MEDRDRKNRNSFGEEHGSHKLSNTQVAEIRALHVTEKNSLRDLAEKYGVTKSTIRRVVIKENWKHVR